MSQKKKSVARNGRKELKGTEGVYVKSNTPVYSYNTM